MDGNGKGKPDDGSLAVKDVSDAAAVTEETKAEPVDPPVAVEDSENNQTEESLNVASSESTVVTTTESDKMEVATKNSEEPMDVDAAPAEPRNVDENVQVESKQNDIKEEVKESEEAEEVVIESNTPVAEASTDVAMAEVTIETTEQGSESEVVQDDEKLPSENGEALEETENNVDVAAETEQTDKKATVGEKRKRARISNADKRTPGPLETRQKSKRPKRNAASPFDKLDVELTPVIPTPRVKRTSNTPGSSRKKAPALSPPVNDSTTKPFYIKGNVLAVRNEEGGFYLCTVRSNIYSIAKPFRIQWLDNEGGSDVYQRSYADFLNYNSVLIANVAVKKLDNNKFILSAAQKKKIEHRLAKTLQGSADISSDSTSSDEFLVKSDSTSTKKKKKPGPKPGVSKPNAQNPPSTPDNSASSTAAAAINSAQKGSTSKPSKQTKKKDASDGMVEKVGKVELNPQTPQQPAKRKSTKYEQYNANAAKAKKKIGPNQQSHAIQRGSSGALTSTPLTHRPIQRGRPPKNQSTSLTGSHIKSSEASIGAVRYMINPEVVEQMNTSSIVSNNELVPNKDIVVVCDDPAFSTSLEDAKLPKNLRAIHAAINQDLEGLQKIFTETENLVQLFCTTRSIDVERTVLHYALLGQDKDMVIFLLHQLATLGEFNLDDNKEQPPNVLRDPCDTQNGFKGEELTPVDISKGLKEGNFAFLKNQKPKFSTARELAVDLAVFVCEEGLSPEMLDVFLAHYPRGVDYEMKDFLFDFYYRALDMGHNGTAHFIITNSRVIASKSPKIEPALQPTAGVVPPGGSAVTGLSYFVPGAQSLTDLHENVLVGSDPDMGLYTLKDLKKRTADGHRYQPVHFAAGNQNSFALQQIVGIAKECASTLDGRSRRPVHYAAACTSPESLVFLKQLVGVEEQDASGTTPLMVASEAGRYDAVEILLGIKEVSVERPDRHNRSAIHLAALRGHTKVIVALHKAKADLNKVLSISKARATPLMIAASRGHIETCMKLVELGASVELKDKLQRTALIHAAMNGHYPVVAFLLNRGANPRAADSSNNTAIHYAAAYGWYHCANVLLQAKADPIIDNDRKMPPIGVALLKDHRDVAALLSSHGANPNFHDDRGRNLFARLLSDEPLTWSLADKLAFLLETYQPDVNAQDVHGMSALHYLTQNSVRNQKTGELSEEMENVSCHLAKLLIEAGAALNIADYRGRLPLFFAAQDVNVKMINLLVLNGSLCPRSVNTTSDTILHLMARHWDKHDMAEIVTKLVSTSAAVVTKLTTRRNKFGFSPLLVLAKTIADAESTLYEDGDDKETKRREFEKKIDDRACPLMDALIFAAKSNVSAVVGKTKRNYRNPKDEGKTAAHYLSMATVDRDCKALSCLLRYKPRLDQFDEFGASALIQAIVSRNCRAVQILLDAEAQPNLCTGDLSHKYPCAPLILAVDSHGPGKQSLLPAIRALLRTILDIKQVPADPRNGRTALMSAVEKEEEIDLVNALLEKQASLIETDHLGRTPLHLAVNASGPTSALFDIPDLLIDKGASLTTPDEHGRVPLHYAFTKIGQKDDSRDQGYDPIELTTLLTSNISGDLVDYSDVYGRTPLHEAARRGSMICCMHLVKRGADINLQDREGNTPLSLGVKSGHNSCAVMLIQKGANVNTNVICKPSKTDADELAARTWRLRSTIPHPPKTTRDSVFKVVVQRGWQGVTYVMLDKLESCGVKYAAAVEAAMRARKYQVVLSLLRKQRDSSKLCEKNKQKQNLLHILCINKPEHTEVQIKVASVLIERGVPCYTTDDYGCSPLHYAAFTKNYPLVKFFAERNPQTFHSMIALADFLGRNAISALMWNSVINDEESVQILKLFLEEDRDSCAINRFCNFPVLDFDCKMSVINNNKTNNIFGSDDEEPSIAVRDYFHGKGVCSVINPLVRAIQLRAHKIIDLLLDYNVDINTQVDGIGKQSPLMIAVQQNDEYVVKKLLTHKTPVLLSSLDDDGRTVIHHAAKPLPLGYWENITILKLLMQQGGMMPLGRVDNFDKTALDYALEGGSGRMSDELQNSLGIPPIQWKKPNMANAKFAKRMDWDQPAPDCDIDAVTIIDRIREDETENQTSQTSINPDILSGLREGGDIVVDTQINRHCDVFLTSVDVQQNSKIVYNFFRMQVIRQKGKDLYMFFMRWGVIGDRGTWQTSPFTTPQNAIKEFAKYFKLKTANEWRSVNSFKPQTRKYHLVPADAQRHRIVSELDFDLVTDVDSLLAKEVQSVYNDLINIDSMKKAMKESTNVDPEVVPFGRLERDRLNLGVELLTEVKALLHYCEDLRSVEPLDMIKLQKTLEKIQQKSTEYYRILPPRGGIFDRVRPINDIDTLGRLLIQNNRLVELELANKVLLGAQYRINDMNAIDYVYRSVGCTLNAMDPEMIETQYLLQCIHNTGGEDMRVDCIYRLSRGTEEQDVDRIGYGNHRMLWHGTNILGLLTILHRGLQPIETALNMTSDPIGKEIHLSDMVGRALEDCQTWGSEKKYMLLCQVALGKTREIRESTPKLTENDVNMFHSLKRVGKYIPKPGHDLILPEGGAIALGEKCLNSDPATAVNNYNEYVVLSPEQVCLRYLVRFEHKPSSSTTSKIEEVPAAVLPSSS